jgi:hypothetical protein
MAGPLRRDKPVLIPMYAEISQRPPPPRPFLNLLRSPVHLPLRCLVRALLGLPTVVVAHFLASATGTCQTLRHSCGARSCGADRPLATKGGSLGLTRRDPRPNVTTPRMSGPTNKPRYRELVR